MTRLSSIAIAAALLASALPACSALGATGDGAIRIGYADLNLASDAGRAALSNRVGRAADRLCMVGQVRGLGQTQGCRRDVISTTAPQVALAIQNATVRFADAGSAIVVTLR
jgi:UrcA family protein